MRRELVDRLADSTKPAVGALRRELATAVPWVDPGGRLHCRLHYERWSLDGSGSMLSWSAACPPGGPLGLPLRGNPGLHAAFERRAGQWQLATAPEASTTR
jgi:hypothetical protein